MMGYVRPSRPKASRPVNPLPSQVVNDDDWYPVHEAPKGKMISGALVTCANCGTQIFIRRNRMREIHRWWEKIGWGKIGTKNRSLKGLLYCSGCHPQAHRDMVGE